mmetsp:Transcript_29586/g.87814  ORF Transcript_29586/g.87814 Transcript_29586/m.87814 type:complete len:405 (+) Transcript_29586:694-1908(+)
MGLLHAIQNRLHGEVDDRRQVLALGVPLGEQGPTQGRRLRQTGQRAAGRPVGLLEERLQGVRVDDTQAPLQQAQGLLEVARRDQIRRQLALAQPLGLEGVRHGHVHAALLLHRRRVQVEIHAEIHAAEVQVVTPLRAGRGDVAPEVHVVVVAPAAGALARVLGRLVGVHEGGLRRRLGRLEGALREDLLGGLQQRPVGCVAGGPSAERRGGDQEASVRRNVGRDVAALKLLLQLRDVLRQVVRLRHDGRQRHLAHLRHDLHALLDVAQHQRVVEPRHDVVPHLGDLQHLPELRDVAGDEVQEGQGVEVLGLLVHHLHDLLVALTQGLEAEARPAVDFIELLRRRHGLLDVPVLQGQVEAGLLVLHKVQRDLREALLLEVADHRVPAEAPIRDPGLHVVEVAPVQ